MQTVIPIRTVSEANQREHHLTKAKRVRSHRETTALLMRRLLKKGEVPDVIVLTRLAPKALDGDNLQSALKGCRDGIQDALGINDRHLNFVYAQEQSKSYGVRVEWLYADEFQSWTSAWLPTSYVRTIEGKQCRVQWLGTGTAWRWYATDAGGSDNGVADSLALALERCEQIAREGL
jgi:hypothetical protein